MPIMTKLTIVSAKRQSKASPEEQRRNKLLSKLAEQLALAEALVAGTVYRGTREVVVKAEDGTRSRVSRETRVRAWFWHDLSGKWLLEVRYGARVLELAKGKRAIEMASRDALCDTIKLLQEAVRAGELDAQIEAAVGMSKLRLPKAAA